MQPLSLDHVALPIYDVPASQRFYGEILGLKLEDALSGDDWEGHPWLMLIYGLADGRQLALCALDGMRKPDESLPQDVRHYAFACVSQAALDGWRERLRAGGVAFREEDHGEQQSIYFDDPSGVVWGITTPRGAAQRTAADAEAVVRAWLDARRYDARA